MHAVVDEQRARDPDHRRRRHHLPVIHVADGAVMSRFFHGPQGWHLGWRPCIPEELSAVQERGSLGEHVVLYIAWPLLLQRQMT